MNHPKVGERWRDRDSRMVGKDERIVEIVRVFRTEVVTRRVRTASENSTLPDYPMRRTRLDRFVKAYDRVDPDTERRKLLARGEDQSEEATQP